MTDTKQILDLLPKAALAVNPVGKDGYNSAQKYNFKAIDHVVDAVNPVLGDLGITMTREILSTERTSGSTRNGGTMHYTTMLCRFTFYAPDGSSVTTDAYGEGMDSGDKSANKAMSAALKYALCHALLIPTHDRSDPEWDRADPEASERKALRAGKVALVQHVAAKRRGIDSTLNAGAFIAKVLRDVLDADEVTTTDELDAVGAAIESGEYDLATGDRIPAESTHDAPPPTQEPASAHEAPILRDDDPGQGSLL